MSHAITDDCDLQKGPLSQMLREINGLKNRTQGVGGGGGLGGGVGGFGGGGLRGPPRLRNGVWAGSAWEARGVAPNPRGPFGSLHGIAWRVTPNLQLAGSIARRRRENWMPGAPAFSFLGERGSPTSALSLPFFGWEGPPTKIGYRKKRTRILASLLEDLESFPSQPEGVQLGFSLQLVSCS